MKSNWQRCCGLVNVESLSKKCFSYQGLKMELKVKNLASSDSRGYDLQKEVMVTVTNQRTHEVRLPLGVGVGLPKGFLGTRSALPDAACGDLVKGRDSGGQILGRVSPPGPRSHIAPSPGSPLTTSVEHCVYF